MEGKKEGKGKHEDLLKGSIYNGDFSEDNKNGYGEEKYFDGSIYKGEFKIDQTWGKGRIKWNNKKEYIGEWENSEISGYGMLFDCQVKHICYFSHNMKEVFGANFYEDQSLSFR